ncbi:hypothetical protein IMZ11_32885 [Microtetraspora sp. AC03309]|uniref:hypothetical protein n=1 Tax=Microtetraspora sp. AC03309 TaxID=2779376 RepID=UPI001E57A082|nr:hypothetical protein [Microtetraspora sp. AC03309]MCC5580425.1 hypothetical protein [Microtetraspora sp. AC03309]
MRIRIDGTRTELAYTINKISAILPVGSISPIYRHRRPYSWRVFIDTAPDRTGTRWIA